MAVKVKLPHLLRELTAGEAEVSIEARSASEAIDALEKRFPGVKASICREDGSLHQFVNVYLNDEDVRFLNGLNTELKDNDVVIILPMIAGG